MRWSTFVILCAVLAGCDVAPSAAASTASPVAHPSDPSAIDRAAASPSRGAASAAPSSSPPTLPSGRIVFQRSGDRAGIYVIDADGSHEQMILAGVFGTPKWSPDGNRLAVYSEKPTGRVVPALIGNDGSGYRELMLPRDLNCGLASWSPDGTALALECWDENHPERTGIYLAAADGDTGMRQVTTGHGLPSDFSAAGDRILFAKDAGDGRLRLAVVGIDGSDERTLGTDTIGQMPGFMPEEQGIYVVADGAIGVLDMSGRLLRTIRAPEPGIHEARLSPDARWFVFVYDPGAAVAPGLYRIAVDGTGFAEVAHTNLAGIQEEHPDWAP
jgi:dipeptidyl aminopeptidase/acylaminoacyl peptidase